MSDHTDTTLTDDEAAQIDFAMSEHMRHHAISNNINGMSCSIRCRTEALARTVQPIVDARVAAARAEAWDEGNAACCWPAYSRLNPYRALIEGADQ